MKRPLYRIASEIALDWPPIWYGAVPYHLAMRSLGDISENYGADSGKSIVRYFLSNAATWRGPVARRIKLELKDMLK